jgi:DNA-binding winged helix-turn-helix (wHTH) protein
MDAADRTRRVRFDAFEVDMRSGEVRKHGIRLKLHGQPFQVLSLLLEHPGDLVTREELRQKLWPGETFVDFDTGLNSAVKKLRDALCDSAEEPRYIETLPRRGYRFIAQVENGARLASATVEPQIAPVGTSSALPLRLVSRACSLLEPSVPGASISLGLPSADPMSSSWLASSTKREIPSSKIRWTKPSRSSLQSRPF